MKSKHFFIVAVFAAIITIFYACDSATDSKATSVTPPSLISPADMASGVSRIPTFSWSGEANKLEVSITPDFAANNIVISADVTGTSYTSTIQLEANKFYYWRAGKLQSNTTYWSSNYYTFQTGN